ncbi:MAG: hypothetical protein IT374_21460 [Polyangiaceae bacterium]|nr:hypothetical protein [Polyangiaceae bacterium]
MRAVARAAIASMVMGVCATAAARPVDRLFLLFDAPETGGPTKPVAVFERELAFEARLEALAAGEPAVDAQGRYAPRYLRAALDRHVATSLLASLPVEARPATAGDPCDGPPDAAVDDTARGLAVSRGLLISRVGGTARLNEAAAAEGVGESEIARLVRREAQAARYLDRMVTPMLAPTALELREAYRAPNPFRGRPFDEVRCELRRWVLAGRLGAALGEFLQSSRGRVHISSPR